MAAGIPPTIFNPTSRDVVSDIRSPAALSVEAPAAPVVYRSYENHHALLVIREAPRLGTRATDSVASLLETRQLVRPAATGKIVFATDDFIVDAVQESDQERVSTAYTFSVPFIEVAPNGRMPRIYTYSGILLENSREGSALSRLISSWELYLRATNFLRGAARRRLPYIATLEYRDQIRRGYPISMAYEDSSTKPNEHPFSLSMFIVHEANGVETVTPSRVRTPSVDVSRVPPINIVDLFS